MSRRPARWLARGAASLRWLSVASRGLVVVLALAPVLPVARALVGIVLRAHEQHVELGVELDLEAPTVRSGKLHLPRGTVLVLAVHVVHRSATGGLECRLRRALEVGGSGWRPRRAGSRRR